MPRVVVIAGPNGAGKSTTAPPIVRKAFGIEEFVNADMIAQGLSVLAPETAAFRAGRVMLTRILQLARSLSNFFNLYRPFADSWLFLDNSGQPDPRAIAWRNVGGPVNWDKPGPWERLRRKYEQDIFNQA